MQFTFLTTPRHFQPFGNVGQNWRLSNGRYRQAYFAIVAVALAILAIGLAAPACESGMQLAKQSGGSNSSSPCLVAGQYYVATSGSDSNEGSSCKPWATIQHAAVVVGPGATVHVKPGTYSTGTITTNASGIADARITYVSDEKWGAKLQGVGANIVWANHGNFVDIQGFEVIGDSATTIGLLNYASNVRYLGNNVHTIPAKGCPENGGAGIDNYGADAKSSDVVGNWIHDIGDFTNPCPRVHGIYQATSGGHIWNNVVFRNQGWGIHLYGYATNVVVANNTVFRNGYGGIVVAGGPTVIDDNTLVSNNIVYQNGLSKGADGNGIEEFGAYVGSHNRYLNNSVSNNGPVDWNLRNKAASATLQSDPQFVNFRPDGTGDYHLLPSSPAIDAGTSEGAPGFDFDGNPRPSGRGYDIGAFELQSK